MKAALYDLRLRECPTTYDYFVWLMQIQLMGYTHVNYKTDYIRAKKHGGDVVQARQRFDNFIWPSTLFAKGMTRAFGSSGDRVGNCMIPDLIKLLDVRSLPRLESIQEPANVKYTVTLRQMEYKPERNSDLEVWRKFAAEIGAHVIEDHFVKPITMQERMAFYAGANMNFGVMGGPMALLLWTPYPLSVWCDPAVEALTKSMNGHGMNVGGQWPFQLNSQRLVWKEPTLENLLAHFERIER